MPFLVKSNKIEYFLKEALFWEGINSEFIIWNIKIFLRLLYINTKIKLKKLCDNLNDNNNVNLITKCKYLKEENHFCIFFQNYLKIFNSKEEKLTTKIIIEKPKSVKIIQNFSNSKKILIICRNIIYEYNLWDNKKRKALKLGKINDIKKVKQLSNKDLAICFGYHNLGIYDLKYNLIKFQLLNNLTEKINIFPQYFILKEIDKNLIIFNNNRNALNIINSIKGETIAKFFDEEFEIICCKKIILLF